MAKSNIQITRSWHFLIKVKCVTEQHYYEAYIWQRSSGLLILFLRCDKTCLFDIDPYKRDLFFVKIKLKK